MNTLDKIISRNILMHQYNSLNGNLELKDGTSVTLASVFDPKDKSKMLKENLLVLIDCGSWPSMTKASLFVKYKNRFFIK